MWRDVMIWNGTAKRVFAAVAACVAGCASPEEPDTLPPPPGNATASCIYQLVTTGPIFPDPDPPTSTLWLDGSGQVIRVDGWRWSDSSPYRKLPTAYDLTWDGERRLLGVHGGQDSVQFVYSADQVLEMFAGGDTVTHHLVDGRDVRVEGAPDPKTNQRYFINRAYDAAGRLTSQRDGTNDLLRMTDTETNTAVFAYDAQGRIVSFQSTSPYSGDASNYSFSYTETSDQLVVDVVDLRNPRTPVIAQTWTFELDASHRLVRDAVDEDGDGYDDFWDDFRYLDGEIDVSSRAPGYGSTARAVGACVPPSVVLAPSAPMPIQFQSRMEYRSLPNEAARALANLGAAGSLMPYPY